MKRFLKGKLFLAAAGALMCSTAFAIAQSPNVPVRVTKAELKSLAPRIEVSGQVQTHSAADLAASLDGDLAYVAEVGTQVKKGDAVARLDTTPLSLQRAEQAARLTRAQIALKQAQREAQRLRDSGDAVSRFQLDQAENARELAEADLQLARVTLAQTDEKLSRMSLRAQADGVVIERVKRAGEHAVVGDVVARVAATGGLEVHLFLPLRHVRAISPGSMVAVRTEGREVSAPVHAIVPVGDMRSQTFELVIDAERIQPALAVGALVQVQLPLAAPKDAVAVPRDALIVRADGMAVFRVKDGKAQRVAVTPGVADGDWIAVEGGVAADDQVVVRGGESLHDGDSVQILAAK